MFSKKIICRKCGAEKESSFCDFYKTNTPSDISILVSETIGVRDNFRIRKFITGIKKFTSEFLSGWFQSGDHKLPDGVDKLRIINREKRRISRSS